MSTPHLRRRDSAESLPASNGASTNAIEDSPAIVVAEEHRQRPFSRWLSLMGARSCRSTTPNVPTSALSPQSSQEMVLIEATTDEIDEKALELRQRGWQHVVVSAADLEPATAVAALRRGVRNLVRRNRQSLSLKTESGWQFSTDGDDASPPVDESELLEARQAVRLLTARERAVLQLVARGHSNKEIADELDLSPLTIKSHLSRIGRKVEAGERSRMILIALRGGAIS